MLSLKLAEFDHDIDQQLSSIVPQYMSYLSLVMVNMVWSEKGGAQGRHRCSEAGVKCRDQVSLQIDLGC